MSENKKETFLKGAVILGLAGVLVKILGAVFRIPLGGIITGVGMGYYQTAYPIYVLLVGIATSGFPVAISKMVSERRVAGNYKGADKVFWLVFKVLAIFGVMASSFIFFGAEYIVTERLQNPKAYWAMISLAPALLVVPIMAAFRGYFQGHNDMRPSAISQIVEQIGRVVVGLLAAQLLVSKGLEYGAAGGSFGATAGALAGLSVLLVMYVRSKKKDKDSLTAPDFAVEPSSKILRELGMIAFPIIIGALVMPVMVLIDVALVMRRLQSIGFSNEEANLLYGQLSGMAATLVNLPQVVTSAVAVSLVPVISSAFVMKDHQKLKDNTALGIRTSILIGLPAGVGLFALSTPIMQMLFPKEPDSLGHLLAIASIGVVFLSVIQSTTSVLQGLGKTQIPVINLFIGALVKLILTYVLTGIPLLNVKGAAISTVSAYIIAAGLDYLSVKKRVNFKFDIQQFLIKPLITSAIMGISARGTYEILYRLLHRNSIAVLMGVLVGALVYVIALFKTGSISKEELMTIPKGQKLVAKLEKIKLI